MSRLDDALASLRRLEAEIRQLERFGRDSFEDGDVVRFTKTYGVTEPEPRTYIHAAVKTPVGWYLTGQNRKTVWTYDELIEFIVQYPLAENIVVAVTWADVVQTVAERALEANQETAKMIEEFLADPSSGIARTRPPAVLPDETQYAYVERREFEATWCPRAGE